MGIRSRFRLVSLDFAYENSPSFAYTISLEFSPVVFRLTALSPDISPVDMCGVVLMWLDML